MVNKILIADNFFYGNSRISALYSLGFKGLLPPSTLACCHGGCEALEQVIAVLWAGAGFGVVLNGKDWAILDADAAI